MKLIVQSIVLSVIMVAVVLFRVSFTRRGVIDELGLKRGGVVMPLCCALGAMALMFAVAHGLELGGWNAWVSEHFGDPLQSSVKILAESQDLNLVIAMSVMAVAVAPVAEEVIFRGYVYGALRDLTNRWYAVLFGALFFAVIHGKLASLPMLFVFGILLSGVYELTRTLWAPVACHVVFNALTVANMLGGRLS